MAVYGPHQHRARQADHISDHDLERLILGMVKDEAELERLEQYLLVCAECIERADEARQYVGTMKTALTANTSLGNSDRRWLEPLIDALLALEPSV
jgi:hypothetical protein